MKTNLIAIFCMLFGTLANAQTPTFIWAKNAHGDQYSISTAMATDAAGNVYSTGTFIGTVDFDPGPGVFNLTSDYSNNIFLQKLDANGNFVWAKRMGTGGISEAYAITVDAAGNIYTTGWFWGSGVDFDPGPGINNLRSNNTNTFFVCKLDATGNFVWARASNGYVGGLSIGNSVAVDADGNVYTTGNLNGKVDFDPGPGVYDLPASSFTSSSFILKLDAAGHFSWAKMISNCKTSGLTVDKRGNIYSTGSYFSTANFFPESYSKTAKGPTDMLVLKLSPAGNYDIISTAVGGPTIAGTSIAVDATENMYITGYLQGTAFFYSFTFLTALSNKSSFIAKFDNFGNKVWAKVLAETSDNVGLSIKLDATGDIYTSGIIGNSPSLTPWLINFNVSQIYTTGAFFLKVDDAGNFVWTKKISGNIKNVSMGMDGAANIYAAGTFSGDFVPGDGVYTLTASGTASSYALKLTEIPSCTPPTFRNDLTIVLDASECGNDGNISIIPTSGTAPFMYSIDGGKTYVEGADYGHTFQELAAGSYKLRLKDSKGCESEVVTREVRTFFPCPTCTPPTFKNDNTIVLDASCNGNDGNISIIPTSGTAPFMYSIDGGKTYVEGPATGYTFQNLSANTYQLRLKDAKACESEVVTKDVKANAFGPCVVAPAQNLALLSTTVKDGTEVVAYPNPSQGRFRLQIRGFGAAKLHIEILDSHGTIVEKRQVKAGEANVFDINLSNKAKGLYLVRVVSATGIRTQKVTLQ